MPLSTNEILGTLQPQMVQQAARFLPLQRGEMDTVLHQENVSHHQKKKKEEEEEISWMGPYLSLQDGNALDHSMSPNQGLNAVVLVS